MPNTTNKNVFNNALSTITLLPLQIFFSSPSSYLKQSSSSRAGGWKMVMVLPFIHRWPSTSDFSRTRSSCSSCLRRCQPLTCCCQASSTCVLGLRTTTLPVFGSMSPSSGECEQSGIAGQRGNDWGEKTAIWINHCLLMTYLSQMKRTSSELVKAITLLSPCCCFAAPFPVFVSSF